MNGVLMVLGSVFVLLAAIAHIGFFLLESVLWSRPRVWRLFGVASQADADAMRPMAYNQGFYNAFLALGGGLALILIGSGISVEGGGVLAMFVLVVMVLAAIVLITSNRRFWRGALLQGGPPLIGLLLLAAGLVF